MDAFEFELFVGWLGFVFILAYLPRVFFRRDTSKTYVTLLRPSFSPPPFIFGIVWGILYPAMAVAVHLVRMRGGPWVTGVNLRPLVLFCVLQLFLTSWSIAFDLLQQRFLAAVIVFVSLVISIIVTVMFYAFSTASGIIMTLLSIWLAFAFVLALAIAIKNSGSYVERKVQEQSRSSSHGRRKGQLSV